MTDAIKNALRKAAGYTDTSPSDGQKAAGNYAKGKLRLHGLEIAIENPKGSERSGVDDNGKRWAVRMPAHYGYVLGTEGKDGDHLDVYIGPDTNSRRVFVVDQVDAGTGRFDEHKAMLCYPSKMAALADYERAFSDGKAKDRIGSVTEMSFDEFTAWGRSGATKKPAGSMRKAYASGGAVPMPDDAKARSLRLARGYASGGVPKGDWRSDMDAPRPHYNPATGEWVDPALSQTPTLTVPERRNDPTRTPIEKAIDAVLDYGPLPAKLAVEATGGPSIMRGVDNIRRGIDEGDVVRGVGGAGQVALGVIPGASMVRGPVGAAVGALMPSLPAAIATTTALGLPIAIADGAEAGARNAVSSIDNDPTVRRLRSELAAVEAMKGAINSPEVDGIKADLAATEKDIAEASKLNYRSKEARTLALQPLIAKQDGLIKQLTSAREQLRTSGLSERSDRTKALRAQIEAAEKAAGAAYMTNAPFRERYPGAAEAILGAGLTGAFGAGAMKGLAKSWGDAARGARLDAATSKADDAIAALTTGAEGSSAHGAATAQELLRRRLASWDRKHSPIEAAYQGTGNVVKGALIGTEASALPEQIDYVTFDPGHPTRENAASLFKRPDYWAERAVPAVSGGAAAFSGAALGKGAGRAVTGGYAPDIDRARMVASWGDEPSFTQTLLARLTGREAKGLSDVALDRVRRHQEAVSRAEAPTLNAVEQTRQAQQASRELSLGTSEAQRRLGAPGASSGLSEAAQPRRQQPASESAPNSTSPSSMSIGDASPPLPVGQALPGGGEPKVLIRTRDSRGHAQHRNLDGRYAPKPSKKSKDEPDGRRHGGAIGRALETARRYANGGAVLVGPVVGETDGRADELPVDVPAGAYVIPADVVSALGSGNTLAGMEMLKGMFGESMAPERAAGGAVPILISHGEFVVSPEQVAAKGGGDISRGHKVMDALVLKLRKQHIDTLKGLPGPAKGSR